ncbi:glycosyltransferase family 4 protein [Hymenobacter monticola]|uniref:Glycosyltransferase family 4 protein n=1 Tax=Hymenobacter monticola TaxID=1705399 RepID=A0ABY4B840_9BACT|nr:glycosyltransferase family 4 protein [Hymenobacter monticola]UOE33856.1 glycosyltransferase family 4 protein [Hymenobacter monticola]
MTPSDFSVLLLAWDDADPSVAVLGGAALPPTLPLVYHLAQEQPVLAVFPHLPEESGVVDGNELAGPVIATETTRFSAQGADAATKASVTEEAFATEDTETSEGAFGNAAFSTAAGVRRLDAVGASEIALPSFLIGLEELATTATPAEMPAALPAPIITAALAPAPIRSQWPTGANAPQHLSWSAPAAPYLGASAPAGPPVVAPVPPLVPAPIVREAADLAQAALSWPAGFSPLASSVAAQVLAGLPIAPGADAAKDTKVTGATEEAVATEEIQEAEADNREPSTSLAPEVFEEITEEIGAAEANDLAAPEDNLTPDIPEETTPIAETAPAYSEAEAVPTPMPAPVLTPRTPPLDGLNSRMIHYARQAAQLVRDRSDFGVIYAPSWPAWLAALEIRNSSRRPLVLYAASLAADFAPPAERGWLLEVERMALRRARLVLVPDESVRQQLRQHYGPDTGEVRVLPAGDEDALQAVLQELAAG